MISRSLKLLLGETKRQNCMLRIYLFSFLLLLKITHLNENDEKFRHSDSWNNKDKHYYKHCISIACCCPLLGSTGTCFDIHLLRIYQASPHRGDVLQAVTLSGE